MALYYGFFETLAIYTPCLKLEKTHIFYAIVFIYINIYNTMFEIVLEDDAFLLKNHKNLRIINKSDMICIFLFDYIQILYNNNY